MPVDSTRSRSGCLTCRKRKKKCDEEWGTNGNCRRCHAGSWECVRPSTEPKRIVKRSTSPKPTTTNAIKVESNTNGKGGDVKMTSTSTPSSSIPNSIHPTQSLIQQQQQHHHQQANPYLPQENPLHPSHSHSHSTSHLPSHTFPFLTYPHTTLTNSPLPAPPPLLDPLLDSSHPSNSTTPLPGLNSQSHPNTVLDTFFESLDAFADPDSFTIDWDDLTNGLSPLGQQLSPATTNAIATATVTANGGSTILPANGGGSGSGSGLLSTNGSSVPTTTMTGSKSKSTSGGGGPSDSNVLLNTINSPDRDRGERRLVEVTPLPLPLPIPTPLPRSSGTTISPSLGLTVGSSTANVGGRAGGSASGSGSASGGGMTEGLLRGDRDDMGAQATPLYAQFNDGFFRSIPKPVREMMTQRMENVATSSDLGRAASMAMVLLYRVRSQGEGDGGGAEAQARLIEQSNQYFQQALAHLQSPVPLEAQLVAVLDMQIHQFDQWGAAAANAILLIGEFFITEGLGPRPTLNLSTLFDPSNIAMRCIAYTDVLRTVHSPRRKTLFSFSDAVGDSPRENYTPQSAVETHLGLPGGLLLCLAATSNLSAEKESYSREEFREKAGLIEKAIKDWRAAPPEDDIDSISYVEDVATQEMWRHAAVIHLYQTVHRVGPLHKSLRHSLSQMLQLGSRIAPRPPQTAADNLYAGCVRACPWFLAATVALPQERDICRHGLASCGPHKGYQDNVESVEKIWALQDEDGQAGDWREVLEREGKVVAFL